MASPRVFVSSTAYDFSVLRGQIRNAIHNVGFESVLSENSDILYDPREHVQTSCVREVIGCDFLVLVVGGRFGSDADPQALADVDMNVVATMSADAGMIKDEARRISITQLEVLKAVEQRVPIYAFVDERVHHDYQTHAANRGEEFVDKIVYPSISQPSLAKYVFSFLDFLSNRLVNNSITPFAHADDIERHLVRQWASLFQRLLGESRSVAYEQKRIDSLTEQLDDLKVALLSTMGDAHARQIARGTLKYRYVLETLRGLQVPGLREAVEERNTWPEVLGRANILDAIPEPESDDRRPIRRVVLRCADGRFLRGMMSVERFQGFADEWSSFISQASPVCLAIFDGVMESFVPSMSGRFHPIELVEDSFGDLVVPRRHESGFSDEEPF